MEVSNLELRKNCGVEYKIFLCIGQIVPEAVKLMKEALKNQVFLKVYNF